MTSRNAAARRPDAPDAGGPRHRLLETAMGWAWFAAEGSVLVKSELPVERRADAEAAVRRWNPASVETRGLMPDVAKALVAYYAGRTGRVAAPLALDRCGDFLRRVYDALMRVAPGEVVTYGELARMIGAPGAARSVGTALSRNPFPPIVPCHRVIAANASLGGFSSAGGLAQKRRLLELEGHALRASRGENGTVLVERA